MLYKTRRFQAEPVEVSVETIAKPVETSPVLDKVVPLLDATAPAAGLKQDDTGTVGAQSLVVSNPKRQLDTGEAPSGRAVPSHYRNALKTRRLLLSVIEQRRGCLVIDPADLYTDYCEWVKSIDEAPVTGLLTS